MDAKLQNHYKLILSLITINYVEIPMLIAANKAVIHTNMAKSRVTNSLTKLTTGSRITDASTDSGALSISSNQQAQQRSSTQAMRNINDGISLLHTMEGSLDILGDIVVRMRELSVQSSTETYTDSDRQMIKEEFD